MMMGRLLAALAVMAVAACASNADEKDSKVAAMAKAAAAKSANGGTQEYTPKPGEGVLCMAAMLSVANEVGQNCFPEYNPAGQTRLQAHLKKLEDYMRASESMTDDDVNAFFIRQGWRGDKEPKKMCKFAKMDVYYELTKEMIDADGARLSQEVDKMTARRGQPAWGDCL